jgi:hypothetical protein
MGLSDSKILVVNPASGAAEYWSANQVIEYYQNTPANAQGNTPPLPISSDWYMSSDGPGRFYNPSQFPVVQGLFDGTIQPPPGTYTLDSLATQYGSSINAKLNQYFTDVGSDDYTTRALIFGETSAKISGTANVSDDGTVTLQNVTIVPYDDQFNFLVNKDYFTPEGYLANTFNYDVESFFDANNNNVPLPMVGGGMVVGYYDKNAYYSDLFHDNPISPSLPVSDGAGNNGFTYIDPQYLSDQFSVSRNVRRRARSQEITIPILISRNSSSAESWVDLSSPVAPNVPVSADLRGLGDGGPARILCVDDLLVRRHLAAAVQQLRDALA